MSTDVENLGTSESSGKSFSDFSYHEQVEHLRQIRLLAERGRSTPLLGGEILILWGIIISFVLILFGFLGNTLSNTLIVSTWIAASILAGLGTFLIYKKYEEQNILPSYRNSIITRAWTFISVGLFAVILTEVMTGSIDSKVILTSSSLLFAVALAISSTLVKTRVVFFAAIGWIGIATLLQFVTNDLQALKIVGFSSILFLVVPGIFMVRGSR